MGSTFQARTFREKTTDKLRKAYESYVKELEFEYGHNPYNGTFSTCGAGLRITDKKFAHIDEAEQWLMDNHSKWDSAMAVQLFVPKKHFHGSATDLRLTAKYHALNDEAMKLLHEGKSVKAIRRKIEKLQEKRKQADISYHQKKYAKAKKPSFVWIVGAWCAE